MDKIRTQLETLFADSNVEVLTRLVRAVALNSPALDATLRDDCKSCLLLSSTHHNYSHSPLSSKSQPTGGSLAN